MTDFSSLRFEVLDGIATITLDRPERLNALDAALLDELGRAVDHIGKDPGIRGVVVTGAGRAFAAGADIAELARLDALGMAELSRRGQKVFRAIELSRKPFIAAVNGFALGGGAELTLACHLRVASTNARFGFPEVKLGTICGYGGTVRLPRIVGKGNALHLILTGTTIDAGEARRIGLANQVETPENLMGASVRLLREILSNGPVAVGFAIESVTRGLEAGADDALALEANLFGLLAATDDLQEGTSAFLEKRTPLFQGR
ncbi:MAG: enoyl-CoA hydratase/isomerase family protein [Gemmatimonadota bacterium]|jgi:enoyl-CoA hydratase|nr:enoyl-CoA hydratase/isomerase family protein [Gemmatimonadota bacterium]